MIISASYRTDIPAFYADWFAARWRAGTALVANPYGSAPYRVALGRQAVDGLVFWSRNPLPFRPVLDALHAENVPFVLQLTVTGYPRALDRRTPGSETLIEAMRGLRASFGARAVVWRYDPILISSLTDATWHLRNFTDLARALAGVVDEVTISFAHIYAKSARNLAAAAEKQSFTWRDPPWPEKQVLHDALAEIAAGHRMRLTVCAQAEIAGQPARCIDGIRLSDVAGQQITARQKGNRPGCLCAESRDIGAYDTCPHGCVYCYAVSDPERARRRHRAHDAASERLGEGAV